MSKAGDGLLWEFDEEIANTRKMLACVPNDKLGWRPHEKSFTLARLAGHVAEMPDWVVRAIMRDTVRLSSEKGKSEFTAYFAGSREEALARFDELSEQARDLIAGVSEESLAQMWTLTYDGKTVFSRPRGEILRVMFMNHLIHHRGQLSVYLRLLDVPIPGTYGPSADTRAAMVASLK
jgi:uncharacterized damage-inducible protein DinB